jgi:dipeptidyl aminopeptidase/acylaminoacyl peptidase
VLLEAVCSIPIEEFLVSRLAFTPDGHHILIGHRNLTLYDVLSGRALRTFAFDAFAAAVAFSPDGRYLACVNDDDRQPHTAGLARIFDTQTGETVWQAQPPHPVETGCFIEHQHEIVFLYKDVFPNGANRLSGCRLPWCDAAPGLDLAEWNVREVVAHAGAVTVFGRERQPRTCEVEGASLDFYPAQVAAFSYPDGAPGRLRRVPAGSGLSRLSPCGSLIALQVIDFRASEHRLSLINLETGAEARLALAPDTLPAFVFSCDGGQFLCLTDDPESGGGLLRGWDARTLTPLGRTPFPAHYHKLALHWPTGRLAALGGGRCDVHLIRN